MFTSTPCLFFKFLRALSFWYRLFAREDGNHQVCIAGLTEQRVHNVEELMEVYVPACRVDFHHLKDAEWNMRFWLLSVVFFNPRVSFISQNQNCICELELSLLMLTASKMPAWNYWSLRDCLFSASKNVVKNEFCW